MLSERSNWLAVSGLFYVAQRTAIAMKKKKIYKVSMVDIWKNFQTI